MRLGRKLYGGIGVAIAVLIVSAVAFAYYGGSGTGSASASAGHAPRTVTVTGSLDAGSTPLYPGDVGLMNITVTLTGPGNARIAAVTANSIDTSNEPACDPAWFSFSPPDQGPNPGQIPDGSNVSAGNPLHLEGSLQFIDQNELQDACSDATVTVNLVASPN